MWTWGRRWILVGTLILSVLRGHFAQVSPPSEEVPPIPFIDDADVVFLPDLELRFDPPNGTVSPTALSIYFHSNHPSMKFFYDINNESPTIDSPFLDSTTPYLQITTPYKATRDRHLRVIGLVYDSETETYFRTEQLELTYFVESADRPYSFGYFIPGVESGGYFLQVGLEMEASARAQAAEKQEFADFNTNLGIGTYDGQIKALHLPSIDPDLIGFEGGFPFNLTVEHHYGLLIPFHNGKEFFGKVVKVNLKEMNDPEECASRYLIESIDEYNTIHRTGPSVNSPETACVHILDLRSMYPDAKGFRRGFLSYPYGYLAAGVGTTVVRLDLEHFGLLDTKYVDLSHYDPALGGFSGGFADGNWACFKTFSGFVGGIRSKLSVDWNNYRPYYNALMVCVGTDAWENLPSSPIWRNGIRVLDLSSIDESLRGFSDAIRVGRYAYLAPLQISDKKFSSKIIRINLGEKNIVDSLDHSIAVSNNFRSMVRILDFSKKDQELRGFSGVFLSGRYLFFVPFRNKYDPLIGQRGHGKVVRLDMNDFSLSGIQVLEVSATPRSQIPSYIDINLRGFASGFSSGLYGYLVPFFNGKFSGKVGRFLTVGDLELNLQELDLEVDRDFPNTYHGYRGGFASHWQGVDV